MWSFVDRKQTNNSNYAIPHSRSAVQNSEEFYVRVEKHNLFLKWPKLGILKHSVVFGTADQHGYSRVS